MAFDLINVGTAPNAGDGDPLRVGGQKINANYDLIREKLTANRTYYVRTDGNDSNTGLVNNAGGAFLTIQRALDVAATLDINGYQLIIRVGAGTYTGAATLPWLTGLKATWPLLEGDDTTPSNVIISATNTNAITQVGQGNIWNVRGFTLTTTTGGNCLAVSVGGCLTFRNMVFGTSASAHVVATTASVVRIDGDYSITGGASFNLVARDSSYIGNITPITVTLTGTPAFSGSFISAGNDCFVNVSSGTFTGSATGKRYDAYGFSYIRTGTGNVNYLPGSIAGTTSDGSHYDNLPVGLVTGDIGSTVQAYDADTAKTDVAQTFAEKQTFGNTVKLQQALEKVTITAGAPSSTQNFDWLTQAVQYFTTNSANNWTLNVRGNSGTTLNASMATGESITIATIVTNGSTAYYMTALTVDGNSITPQWMGAPAPAAGTPNKCDTYTVTIIKTAPATFIAQATFAGGN